MELALGFLFLALAIEIAFHAWERNNWSQERRELVQRIQAPEQAVTSYTRKEEDLKPLVPIALDDDEGYEALRLSREGSVPD
jgi:hypothetical protein